MTWFVHRRLDNSIASLHRELQSGYAEESLADNAAEVITFLALNPPPDLSNMDNMDKVLKAFALVVRDYTNALQAGTHTQKTINQLKADFLTKYNSLP